MKIYTIYNVGISGNEIFPRGGDLLYLNANSANDALKKAILKDSLNFVNIPLRYYKNVRAYADRDMSDISITIIYKGKKQKIRMQAKANALWEDGEEE